MKLQGRIAIKLRDFGRLPLPVQSCTVASLTLHAYPSCNAANSSAGLLGKASK
jgi:hypothetical protein